MAPSTSILTARISPNITMFDIVTPITANSAKVSRNAAGTANPTSSADRVPRLAGTTIITRAMAVSTDPSVCATMLSTWGVRSSVTVAVKALAPCRAFGGHRLLHRLHGADQVEPLAFDQLQDSSFNGSITTSGISSRWPASFASALVMRARAAIQSTRPVMARPVAP